MTIRQFCSHAAAILFLAAPSASQAVLISTEASLTPSATVDFQQFTSVAFASAMPVQVGTPIGHDIELYGLGSFDTYAGPASHSLGGNGSWNSTLDVNFRSAGQPTSTSTGMRFDFNDGPVSGVGGFMNYAPGFGSVTIEALDIGGGVLESYDLVSTMPISTTGMTNAGAFRGILRLSEDIYSFRILSSAYSVIDNFTFVGVPVPEPSTMVFVAIALSGFSIKNRR